MIIAFQKLFVYFIADLQKEIPEKIACVKRMSHPFKNCVCACVCLCVRETWLHLGEEILVCMHDTMDELNAGDAKLLVMFPESPVL